MWYACISRPRPIHGAGGTLVSVRLDLTSYNLIFWMIVIIY